jgi:hypothetical protein
VVTISTGKTVKLSNVPSGDHTLSQATFSPDGKWVVYTAYDAGGSGGMSRKLGSIYCFNRPSKLYASSVDGHDNSFICLTPDSKLARSPRFSNRSPYRLVFLHNSAGFDTHNGVVALGEIQWETNPTAPYSGMLKRRDLIDAVRGCGAGYRGEDESFPGLFTMELPNPCFSSDDSTIYTNTHWRSRNKVIEIDSDSGEVKLIKMNLMNSDDDDDDDNLSADNDGDYSEYVHCVGESGLIVSQESPLDAGVSV